MKGRLHLENMHLTGTCLHTVTRSKCTTFVFIEEHNEKESGSGSSVSIATELRVGRSGIESRRRRDFPPVQTGPGAHPDSSKMGTGSFPGVKCGRGVMLSTHPHFQCCGHGRVELYLYPPSGPHRACNRITLPFFNKKDIVRVCMHYP